MREIQVKNMAQTDKMRKNAQTLRKNMTREERHLWYDFLKSYPVQFRRQQVFCNYIVDFYCYKAQLVVELDGSQHCAPEELAYDRKRTEYLARLGLYVLRISNLDVMRQFEAVCQTIDMAVKSRLRK